MSSPTIRQQVQVQTSPNSAAKATITSTPNVTMPEQRLLWKHGLDFIFAVVLLMVTAPITLVAALLIKLTSRGPVFYTQTRTGRLGKPFTIIKLRTMTHNCEDKSGARWSTPGDPRITPIGRFLRHTHIDEFPQLWNVLRGEMSLVGPRPERPEFLPPLEKAIPGYRGRLQVRPGITGLAQIQLPPDTNLESVRRKLAYDLYYVSQRSWWLDVRVIFVTAINMIGLFPQLTKSLVRLPSEDNVLRRYHDWIVTEGEIHELQPA